MLWSNVNGKEEEFGEEEEKWFKKMRKAMGGVGICIDFPTHRAMRGDNAESVGQNFFSEIIGVDLYKPNDGKYTANIYILITTDQL